MKTYSSLLNMATTLSQNTSAANQTLFTNLMNEQQRLLLEKYFDNERTFTSTTVGAMSLAITGALAGGATTANLTGSWNYPSGQQRITFTNSAGTVLATTAISAKGDTSATLASVWTSPTGLQRITFDNGQMLDVLFTNSSAAISWTIPLTSATSTTNLTTASTSEVHDATFINGSTIISWTSPLIYAITNTTIITLGYQKYRIPAAVSKITNETIMVGQLRFVPAPVATRTEWDNLNFIAYSSDIPNYFYVYGGYVEFWPIPSTTGNLILFNYKSRIPDFSTAFLFSDASGTAYVAGQTTYDYQQGTITSATMGSVNITGTGTKWITSSGGLGMKADMDISQYNLALMINQPYGDGLWYPIQQFHDDTHLILSSPIMNAPNISSATYSIGQLPVLKEDFQETLVYGALKIYFSTIVPDPNKFKQFDALYNERMLMLSDYGGTKQVSYNLGERPALLNPNLYPYYPGNVQTP